MTEPRKAGGLQMFTGRWHGKTQAYMGNDAARVLAGLPVVVFCPTQATADAYRRRWERDYPELQCPKLVAGGRK